MVPVVLEVAPSVDLELAELVELVELEVYSNVSLITYHYHKSYEN